MAKKLPFTFDDVVMLVNDASETLKMKIIGIDKNDDSTYNYYTKVLESDGTVEIGAKYGPFAESDLKIYKEEKKK